MTWTMGLPVLSNSSFDDDEVSSKKIALSATLTSCSFLTTLLTISSFVMISTANKDDATRQPRIPSKILFRTFDFRFMISLRLHPLNRHAAAASSLVQVDLGTTCQGPDYAAVVVGL